MVINIVLIIVLVLVLVMVKNYSSILLISRISFRNLIRHKRRNILLGSAIAFGVMIIFVSNGFAAGITDILFNKVVVNMTGHVGINFYEQGKEQKNIMRDKEKILERIKSSGIEIKEMKESVMIFVRIIGNGKGDNVALSGINISENMDKNSLKNSHKVIQGSLEPFINGTVENPLIISQKKAAKLNVKVNDCVNVKLTTIYGQQQTAKMTVVAIEKGDSLFSSMSSYTRLDDLKRIMGYKKWESANIQIMIDKPKENARKTADTLYNALKPDTATILSHFAKENRTEEAILAGYGEKAESIDGLRKEVNLISGKIEKGGVLLSRGLAEKLEIKQGELFAVSYKRKYEEGYFEKKFVVTAIIDKNGLGNMAFVNEKDFYEMYLNNSPADLSEKEAEITSAKWNLAPYLCKEWHIAERANTQSDMEKNRKILRKQKVKMAVAEVSTMYESASMIVMMETALNIITLSAVLILFIIILIGIVNTLRMTIRERTREIGTIRAVGMQKNDVQNLFLFEMGFLTIFSVLAGTLVGVIVEKLLGMIKISTNGSPIEMLFNNGHLNFKTDFSSLIFNIGIICVMILAASYFPSKKASELKPNEALRHYE